MNTANWMNEATWLKRASWMKKATWMNSVDWTNKANWIGMGFVVLGIVGLVYWGVTQDSAGGVANMGSVQLPIDGQRWMPLSPIGAVMAAVLGACLVFGDRWHSRSRA